MRAKSMILTGAVLAMLAAPALAAAAKYSYAAPCDAVWSAVKTTLSNPQRYVETRFDEAQHTAYYQIHRDSPLKANGASVQTHVNGISTGAPRQAVLTPEGPSCSLQLLSNRVGLDRDGHKELKAGVDAALAAGKKDK